MADRFSKFTDRARRALQVAQEEADRLGHHQITAEHLVLGVIRDPTAVATQAVQRLHVDLPELTAAATSAASHAIREPASGLSASARNVLELGIAQAPALGHDYVGTEHLLLGLVQEGTNSLAAMLQPREQALERTRDAIVGILNAGPGPAATTSRRAFAGWAPDDRELLLRHVAAFLADPTWRAAESPASLFGRLSDGALQVLRDAHAEAQRFSHNYLGTEHLLLGLVRDPESVAGRLLANLGADVLTVRQAVEFIIGRGDRPPNETPGLTPRAEKVLFLAIDEARRLGHPQAGAEHLLLGVIREGEGIASSVLESLVVNTDRIRTQVLDYLGQPHVPLASARVSRAGRSALLQAQLVARWYYHPQVDTQHLLVGLVRERGVAAQALQEVGVSLPALLAQFESLAAAATGPAERSPSGEGLGYTLAAQAAIERASWEADQRGHPRAGSGHLLLGVVAIDGGQARALLDQLGVSPEAVRHGVEPRLATDSQSSPADG